MTRTKSDAKRAAILEAAVAQFSRYGYRRTSIDEVAREAGTAKGTVYLYFRSKDDLFRAACSHVAQSFLDRAEAALERDLALADKVLALLHAKFTYLYEIVHSSPHALEIIESKNQVAAEVFVAADKRFLDMLAGVLDAADRAGQLVLARLGLTPRSAAALLIRCAHGNASGDAPGERPSLVEYRRRLAEMVRVVLAGLGASSASS